MPSSWQNHLDRAVAGSVASQRTSSHDKPSATTGPSSRHHHRWRPDQSPQPSAPSR
jgi:hypothetical protein